MLVTPDRSTQWEMMRIKSSRLLKNGSPAYRSELLGVYDGGIPGGG